MLGAYGQRPREEHSSISRRRYEWEPPFVVACHSTTVGLNQPSKSRRGCNCGRCVLTDGADQRASIPYATRDIAVVQRSFRSSQYLESISPYLEGGDDAIHEKTVRHKGNPTDAPECTTTRG